MNLDILKLIVDTLAPVKVIKILCFVFSFIRFHSFSRSVYKNSFPTALTMCLINRVSFARDIGILNTMSSFISRTHPSLIAILGLIR